MIAPCWWRTSRRTWRPPPRPPRWCPSGGRGHLAFSDICSLGLLEIAQDLLAPRDDINDFFLDQVIALATDGCTGGGVPEGREECAEDFLPLEVSHPIVRHYATVFFDAELKGEGSGAQDGVFPEVEFLQEQ